MIVARLGGGRTGDYQLFIERIDYGYSLATNGADHFRYGTTIDSFSPNVGSPSGGI